MGSLRKNAARIIARSGMLLAASIAPWPFQLNFSIFLNKSAANVYFFLTLHT